MILKVLLQANDVLSCLKRSKIQDTIEQPDDSIRMVLLCGLPGSGKSTLARSFAKSTLADVASSRRSGDSLLPALGCLFEAFVFVVEIKTLLAAGFKLCLTFSLRGHDPIWQMSSEV